jgi:hypothetical protein
MIARAHEPKRRSYAPELVAGYRSSRLAVSYTSICSPSESAVVIKN